MELGLLGNLLDPTILFFFFGIFAVLVKSNLEIPSAIAKFLSLYLLMDTSKSPDFIPTAALRT